MPEMEQQPKKVADRYLKREILGQGTYGVVYKATDTKVISLPDIFQFRGGPMKLGFRICR